MKAATAWRLIPAILLVFLFVDRIAAAQDAGWPRSLVLATGSPGGPYFAYGEGLARVLTRAVKVETTSQVTQGPAQNIVLMEKKEAMLGFISMGAGLQGWNGTDWAKGTQYRSMRAIFPMYDTAFQFVAPKHLGIRSMDSLSGKRVGVGPRAGTGGIYLPGIFKALGIPVSIRYGSWEDMKSHLIAGELDAVGFVGGVPFPALSELNTAQPVDFIEFSEAQIAAVRNETPEISSSTVRRGTYPSLMADYHTVGVYNFAVAHKDLPDELVYRIVKAVFENLQEMIKAQSAARETLPANIDRNIIIPLHLGAVRYYREAGVAIPVSALAGN